MTCSIEGCERIAERNGICGTHNREARKASAPKAKTPKKRISKTADPEREKMYLAIRKIYFMLCPICSVCEGYNADEIHHKKGREGDLLFDVRYWLPVHRQCHTYIETHPQEAYERGWSLSRLSKEEETI